jgi:poly(glycerol-phosphate) alpha-glucosyltransferase
MHLGHEPQVWCADYGPGQGRVPAGWDIVEGVPVRYLRRVVSYHWSPVVPQAALLAWRADVDVGHCLGMWDGLTLFAAMGFRRAGIPYVLETLGMYPPVIRSIGMKRLFGGVFARGYLHGAQALIATSDQEADRLRHITAKTVMTRPNPLMLPPTAAATRDLRHRLGVAEDEKLIGWLGRISRPKGLDILVDTLVRLPRFHLAIAGPDDGDGASAVLRAAIQRHGIGGRVHVLGPLWGPERDAFLSGLDVFVLPSLTENFGNAAVEAAAVGLPLVVSDHVGAGRWLQELGAAEVSHLNPDSLADAIERVTKAGPPGSAGPSRAAAVRDRLSPARIAAEQVEIYRAAGVVT